MTDITDEKSQNALDQARILSQALPYMQRYAEECVVVKFGGNAMVSQDLATAFAQDIALLKQSGVNPVVVHGGGPQIQDLLSRLGIESRFEGGLRVTDERTIEVVEMVLAGKINKEIVQSINAVGGQAAGLCGKDGNMVIAKKARKTVNDPNSNIEKIIDLGFVGTPSKVNRQVLDTLATGKLIPVIAPVCPGESGETFNVNADTFAGAVAGALRAKRLLFLTDVPGVLDKNGELIRELTVGEAKALIADGTVSGGMIPKVETCLAALELGVQSVVILDGTMPHSVLLELFTHHGSGTMIQWDK